MTGKREAGGERDLSLRTQAEQPACKCQVRLVDHLSVEGDCPRFGVCAKCLDDFARPGEFFIVDGKGAVDNRNLRGMDRHLGGKAGPPCGSTLAGGPGLAPEISIVLFARNAPPSRRSKKA